MCIFFHRDRRSLRGSIGQICQNSPIHGICHWLSRARAVTGWETTLSWAWAVTGWETTLGRAWPVTGWETTSPLLFKGLRYPIIIKEVRHSVFFLLRNYCNSTLLWPTWIKLNLMTYELNVDRFYAQLGVFFSIFVISHDIGMKSGSNWISWPRIFMLTDFTPNWALFSIFVISFDRGIKLGSNWNSWPMNLMLTDFTPNWALFLFSVFHMIEG